MEPCTCCASVTMVPILARTPSVRKSCERRSTPARRRKIERMVAARARPNAASGSRDAPLLLRPPENAGWSTPNNLPAQLTSFVGRDAECAEAVRLLGSVPTLARLVTLTGTGGVGKTRLALA